MQLQLAVHTFSLAGLTNSWAKHNIPKAEYIEVLKMSVMLCVRIRSCLRKPRPCLVWWCTPLIPALGRHISVSSRPVWSSQTVLGYPRQCKWKPVSKRKTENLSIYLHIKLAHIFNPSNWETKEGLLWVCWTTITTKICQPIQNGLILQVLLGPLNILNSLFYTDQYYVQYVICWDLITF